MCPLLLPQRHAPGRGYAQIRGEGDGQRGRAERHARCLLTSTRVLDYSYKSTNTDTSRSLARNTLSSQVVEVLNGEWRCWRNLTSIDVRGNRIPKDCLARLAQTLQAFPALQVASLSLSLSLSLYIYIYIYIYIIHREREREREREIIIHTYIHT